MATLSNILAWRIPWTEELLQWGHKELDTPERLSPAPQGLKHHSVSCL